MKQNYTIARGALDGIEAFLRVAERRNFRQAAEDLGITTSAVSQAIRTLEARVGAPLFTRTTRSVGLTEAGDRFLEHARPAFDGMIAAGEAASGLGARPAGLLRLAAPRAVVPLILQPILVDMAKDGFDAGIRLGEFIAADMVAVRLTPSFRFVVVASPAYLAKRGRPERPEDLAGHACARLRRSGGTLAHWKLENDGRSIELAVSGPMIVNDFPTMVAAALGGVALAQVPEPVVLEHLQKGRLEEVLSRHASTNPGVFLYHSGRRQVLPKLRAFIDHVREHSTAVANQRPRGEV